MLVGAVALMLLALALVVAELFVPSHGVLAALALIVAIASVAMAYQVTPSLGFAFTLLLVVATPTVFFWAVRVYPKTSVGQRVLLKGSANVQAFQDESARLEELLGKQGVAATFLRPAGSIEIEGRRIDAVSESEMIDAGTTVEVIRISGRKVIVKPVSIG